ncbi:MAG TPA: DinB family protein [Flavisolibacter sp.]|jgi:exoribonuclease II|nr:DinB family protein [Flavisolibacter sp.]
MAVIDLSQVPSFFHRYINQVRQTDIREALTVHEKEFTQFLKTIPEDKWNYRYEEGKWSIKEMVQHIIDAERIFAFRALTFAREDRNALPGFDENDYARVAPAGQRSKEDLIEELAIVQRSTILLFNSFGEKQLDAFGTANGNKIQVKALGFVIIGHTLHHKMILQERYLAN